jgi:4-alpha-glucanotransferase
MRKTHIQEHSNAEECSVDADSRPPLSAYHDSQDLRYRAPFGARRCGDKVTLRLMVGSDAPVDECFVRLETGGGKVLQPMLPVHREDLSSLSREFSIGTIFEATVLLPQEPGLVWYTFEMKAGGKTYRYHNNSERLGGEGMLSGKEGLPYQITVYRPSIVPSWFKKEVMYQIYVDRFFNGNPGGAVLNPKKKALLHAHWDDTPFYVRDEKGRVRRWTFFGGNLEGVIAKLPYLEELGIGIIYLNPIFEAASNHKYDTGDYLKIDPMYGDLSTFVRLIREAEKRGISVILDGVFSHTGADSRYFNKYGHYPELGAYQAEISPYYSWYKLSRPGGEYESWWGEEDLPNVNELDPSYMDFILGREHGVARFWLNKGAKGWRLDVADELPDEFIKRLRLAVKETDPEAVLIGEVWEDASNKVSYGKRREYLFGDELDSAMNYPLREALLKYVLGMWSAKGAVTRIMSLYENYPPENFKASMNLIGSHDRARILTLLGDAPPEESLTSAEREDFRLSRPARKKAVKRLKLLSLLQMTLPGVPCIYYGDEAGLEGYSDPYNRGTYPWGREDKALLDWHKKLVWLRKDYDVIREGDFDPFSIGDDVLGFRTRTAREEIIVCANRNRFEDIQIGLPVRVPGAGSHRPSDGVTDVKGSEPSGGRAGILVLELLSGEKVTPDSQVIRSTLKPLEGKVFYILHRESRPATTPFSERSCGILLHVTSLPSRWGIGDMGKDAYRFVDFLAESGQRLWQILPLNPVGPGNSPYRSPSAMAGNPLLISPDLMLEEGLLTQEEVRKELGRLSARYRNPRRVDYPLVREVKERLFRQAWERFREERGTNAGIKADRPALASFRAFMRKNRSWLSDCCLFTALKERYGGLSWTKWEAGAAMRDPETLARLRRQLSKEVHFGCFLQYIFFRQWMRLRDYANSKGVRIIGDIPIYADADSTDTWASRRLFKLDELGNPEAVAGVPPDYFSETGQLWGNPVYNWREMEKDGYSWWKKRIRQALTLCDYVRLDHFRGFEAFWEVPASEATAEKGRWLKGPGKRFFEALKAEFGELPFIAEDLGFITPGVRNLKNILGLPGMRIYQFEESASDEAHVRGHPIRLTDTECVYYSGTHDNDTLMGWYGRGAADLSSAAREKLARRILQRIYESDAKWVIIPLQDILGLGSDARMNTPGTVDDNWTWRMEAGDLTPERAKWLRMTAVETGRFQAI